MVGRSRVAISSFYGPVQSLGSGRRFIGEKRLWEQLGHRTLIPHKSEGENSSASRKRCCFVTILYSRASIPYYWGRINYGNFYFKSVFSHRIEQITLILTLNTKSLFLGEIFSAAYYYFRFDTL